MGHRVVKSHGRRVVQFPCPVCGANLESPLTDAGQTFPCPTCNRDFVVPGAAELRMQQSEEAAREVQSQQRAAERAADEQARQDQLLREAQIAAQEAEAEKRRREAARAEKEKRKQTAGVSSGAFGGGLILCGLLVFALVYLTMVRPLQEKVKDLTDIVERNAERLNTTTVLAERTRELASRTAEALIETDHLARNANRFAHSHGLGY
jgi:hypothetical protein